MLVAKKLASRKDGNGGGGRREVRNWPETRGPGKKRWVPLTGASLHAVPRLRGGWSG